MEVYVDDMVIKFSSAEDHQPTWRKCLLISEHIICALTHKNVSFGVGDRKFLDFMITHRGIKANLNKCETILKMKSLSNLKLL